MLTQRLFSIPLLFLFTISIGIAQLPEAPKGFEWVLNDDYSDEFEGEALDRKKWRVHYKGWEGRPPAKFMPEAISVGDGSLRIQAGLLDKPLGENGEFTLQGGAVQSKKMGALYGYFECRMKASSLSMSSTFWLKNEYDDSQRPYLQTELDVQEAIGHAKTWSNFKTHIKSNTHIVYRAENPADDKHCPSIDNTAPLSSPVDEEYHTYGVWWVDANTLRFYADGKYVYTIEPSTELDDTPFDQPMFVNMVCETYDWEVQPTTEELADDSRNTAYYDYVRAYSLKRTANP